MLPLWWSLALTVAGRRKAILAASRSHAVARHADRHHSMSAVAAPHRLFISKQAVEECLLAQPNTELAASELTALFSPQTDMDRLQLTRCVARVADVIMNGNEEPFVRLRSKSLHGSNSTGSFHQAGGGHNSKQHPSDPLPIEPIAVRALLLAQPQQELPASELRARFSPADEHERQLLVQAIAEHAELVLGAQGEPIVRLRPSEQRPPLQPSRTPSRTPSQRSRSASFIASEELQPITPVERDLVRKVLAAQPGGSMPAEELVGMLAPEHANAKRRLAKVLAEVARVVQKPDGGGGSVAHLILRDENASANLAAPQPPPPSSFGGHLAASSGRHLRHCPSSLTDASRATTKQASMMSHGSSTSAYWAASGVTSASVVDEEPPPPPPPLPVDESTLVGLLRDNGGRMASQALIARFSPLDGAGKRRLAAIVQKTCKTVLPEQTGGGSSGATVVLREMFVWEQTEARAATRIQRAQRERQEALFRAVAAALVLQAGARRRLAFREACMRWEARRAATVIQGHARILADVRQLRRARAELRVAVQLQMAARRCLFARRVAARSGARIDAAVRIQSARRRQLGTRAAAWRRREVRIAQESPEERTAREEEERTALLREKLRRRKRVEQRQQRSTSAPHEPPKPEASKPEAPTREPQKQQQPPRPQPQVQQVWRAPEQMQPVQPMPSPPPPAPVPERQAPTSRTREHTSSQPLPGEVDDDDDDPADGFGAMLARLDAECGGGLLGAAEGIDEMDAGGDYLAAMRQMMSAHGGDDSDEDDH